MTALAMINNIRTPLLPDVPTLEDLGYKGAPSQTWYGLFAPPGTPRPIIDKIAAEVKRVFADKDFVEKYVISRGQVPAINTPDQFAAQIKADRAAAAGGGEGLRHAAAVGCSCLSGQRREARAAEGPHPAFLVADP